jgi:hypothetical protein
MLAALILIIPVVTLIAFTIWAVYRCRKQTLAYLSRPIRPAVKVEDYRQEPGVGIADRPVERKPPCLEFMDRYFERGPMILSGHGGGWGLTRHLTQVRRRRRSYWGAPVDRLEE